jgi:hypothetical protein
MKRVFALKIFGAKSIQKRSLKTHTRNTHTCVQSHQPMVRWLVTGLAFIQFWSFAVQRVAAQPPDASFTSLSLYGAGLSEVGFEKSEAVMSCYQAGIKFSLLMLDVEYMQNYYTWKKAGTLPFGNNAEKPWETLQSLTVSGMYGGDFNPRWSYFALAKGSAAFEKELSDSYLSGGAGIGVTYTSWEKLKLILGGIMAYDDLENLTLWPVAGFQWNQEAASGLSSSVIFPLEAQLNYQFSSSWGVTANGLIIDSTYRLADDIPVTPAGKKKSFLDMEGYAVDLMLNYTPLKHVALSLGPYYAFGQKIAIRDQKRQRLYDKLVQDDAIGGKLTVAFTF